jgi:hypothetical protein
VQISKRKVDDRFLEADENLENVWCEGVDWIERA